MVIFFISSISLCYASPHWKAQLIDPLQDTVLGHHNSPLEDPETYFEITISPQHDDPTTLQQAALKLIRILVEWETEDCTQVEKTEKFTASIIEEGNQSGYFLDEECGDETLDQAFICIMTGKIDAVYIPTVSIYFNLDKRPYLLYLFMCEQEKPAATLTRSESVPLYESHRGTSPSLATSLARTRKTSLSPSTSPRQKQVRYRKSKSSPPSPRGPYKPERPTTLRINVDSDDIENRKRKSTTPLSSMSPLPKKQAFSVPVTPTSTLGSPKSPERRSPRIAQKQGSALTSPLKIIIPGSLKPKTKPLKSCILLHKTDGVEDKKNIVPFDFELTPLPYIEHQQPLLRRKGYEQINDLSVAVLCVLKNYILSGDIHTYVAGAPHSRSIYFSEYDRNKQLFKQSTRQTRVTIHIIQRGNTKIALINVRLNIPKKLEKKSKVVMVDFFMCSAGELATPIYHFSGIELEEDDVSESVEESRRSDSEEDYESEEGSEGNDTEENSRDSDSEEDSNGSTEED